MVCFPIESLTIGLTDIRGASALGGWSGRDECNGARVSGFTGFSCSRGSL